MKKSIGISERLFPSPVIVVGTYNEYGEPNAATFAWGGTASSEPQSVSIAVRPSRYTYEALQRTKAFTVNLPSVEYASAVDYFGLVSGRNARKFAVTRLTPVHGEYVDAPSIAEFPFSMECEVTHVLDLGVHSLFVGAVKDIKVDELFLDDWGNFQFEEARILTYDSAIRAYRDPGKVVGRAFSIGKKYIYQ